MHALDELRKFTIVSHDADDYFLCLSKHRRAIESDTVLLEAASEKESPFPDTVAWKTLPEAQHYFLMSACGAGFIPVDVLGNVNKSTNLEHATQRTPLSVHVRVSMRKLGYDTPNLIYDVWNVSNRALSVKDVLRFSDLFVTHVPANFVDRIRTP
jgi:hypothetical protein